MKKKINQMRQWALTLILLWVNAMMVSVNAQNVMSIKGQILDNATGQAIFGASVVAGKNSVFTDENGSFTLKIASADVVLTVSGVDGYAVREVPLKGRTEIKIELYPDVFTPLNRNIEGLTGQTKTAYLTAAAKSVDIGQNLAVSADELFQSALGGDVRSISRSGVSGMGTSTFIRGLNSLNANAQPLYVVDGVIVNTLGDMSSIFDGFQSNVLANIDVNDIKSVTVLKDGTSLYGSKASNGVCLITTNRGESAVTRIDLNIKAGMTTRPENLPMMDGDAYRVYLSDMYGSAGYSASDVAKMNFMEGNPSAPAYNKYHNVTDWADEVYQTGTTQNYTIGVNGGDDKALYYFSLGYLGNEGVVQTTSMSRINTRFNADIKMAKRLDFLLNLGFTHTQRYLLDDGMNKYTSATYMSMVKSPFLSPYSFTSSGTKTKDYDDAIFGIGNPSAFLQSSSDKNKFRQYYFNISGKPEWHILDNLTLSTLFDYHLNKYMEDYFSPMFGTDPEYLEGYGYSKNTQKSQTMRNKAISDDTRLAYQAEGEKSTFNAILGWRYLTNYYEMDYIESHNSGSDNNTTVGAYEFLQTDGVNNRTNSVSTYLNLDYGFKNRYFLNGVVAVDGSSRFGKETESGMHIFGHSFGVFPSVNAAWLISSEPFMKNVNAINLLKLRAGIDVTGNDGIEDYATMAYFETVRFISYANGSVLTNLENKTLQWETTRRDHAGIDLGLFNERLSASFDIYRSYTKNLLTLKTLNNVAGVKAYWSNEGELSNSGYELSLEWKIVNAKNFRWSVAGSVGHYKNRIEKLPEGVNSYITSAYNGEILTQVGQAAGVFYGYKTKGVYSSEADAAVASAIGGVASPLALVDEKGDYTYFTAGDVAFEEVVVDGVLNEKDKQIIGDPNPDYYGGFSTMINYKRLTLNALFTYSYGNDVYNYLRSQLESASDYSNQTTAALSRWKADGQVTAFPKATYGDPMGNSRFSDRWIEDGSYLRLKTLSLSYNIPLNNMFIKGLNLWVSANNLLTLTDYLGMDPESSVGSSVLYQGIDAGLVPLTRSYYIGVKINL